MSATALSVITALGRVAIGVVLVFIALRLLGRWLRGMAGKTAAQSLPGAVGP
jgi:uncharacterized membrane protein YcaP (DUF421 family)